MLRMSAKDWNGLSRARLEAQAYAIYCERIIGGKESGEERGFLKTLGEYLGGGKGFPKVIQTPTASYHPKRTLEISMNQYLKEDNSKEKNKGERGITNRKQLAEVLRSAEDPERFDNHVWELAKFFRGWGALAEEYQALRIAPKYSKTGLQIKIEEELAESRPTS